jgi:glycosyltransferase involved in cell wall biosynthesis
MSCRLSVITPVLNGIRFIEFCIGNVIDQGCPDVEHIIVDGGSSDGTLEIIRRYAQRYPHIRWISGQDQGQSDAMNTGVSMAGGDILGILNVDDYYQAGTLREVIDRCASLPEPALLVGNCNVWDDDGSLQFVNRPSRVGLLPLLMLYIPAFPANPSAYFYHRSLHDTIGLYDVDEHFAMDLHFLFKALQAAHVTYVDRVWGNYRFLEGTKTYEDVNSGQNKSRVTDIAARYRQQAPLHYRLISLGFIAAVHVYKKLLNVVVFRN